MKRPSASLAVAGRSSDSALGVLFYLTAAMIVLAGGAMRLFDLDHLLVWHDEVFTLTRVFGYAQHEMLSRIFSETLLTPADLLRYQMPDPSLDWSAAMAAFASHPEHSPLYYILTRLATALPVEPIIAARGVAALFGILLIAATYWLMRELFGPGPGAWVAILLVACSPLQFLYAQEARQYSLWMCLMVISSAALMPALRHDRKRDWWLYGLSVTLGFYSHLLFLLLIPVHALFALLSQWMLRVPLARLKGLAVRWLVSVLAALALFSPWLWVLLTGHEKLDQFTIWMMRPIGWLDILQAWLGHLCAAFVDLTPEAEPWWWWMLIPLLGALWHFLRHAPQAGVTMLALMLLVYIGVVLGLDLLLGGSRSLHVRYALPAILAIQMMVAWVIGDLIAAPIGSRRRRFGLLTLTTLLVLGAASELRILQASSWSNKYFSSRNLEVAQIANAGERTLVLASADSGVAAGELISLAYHLEPSVRIWGESRNESAKAIPLGFDPMIRFDPVILLSPSAKLLSRLESWGAPLPLSKTWQWFVLDPGSSAGDAKQRGTLDGSKGS